MSHYDDLQTDYQTDLLFDYFVNEDKINEQLRPELEDLINKRINEDVDIDQQSIDPNAGKISISTDTVNYKAISKKSPSPYKSLVVEKKSLTKNSVRKSPTPYFNKVETIRPNEIKKESARYMSPVPRESDSARRTRARDIWSKLHSLYKRHANKQTAFSIAPHLGPTSDPDELQEELDMHVKALGAARKLMFCKKVLINGAGILEFVNENFNPWEFDMEGFSAHMAAESDDYDEVLEELIQKYSKDGTGNFPPEVRLVVMLIMSAAGFHMSKSDNGLIKTIAAQGGLAKQANELLGGSKDEAFEEPPPDNDAILAGLRSNRRKKSESPNVLEMERELQRQREAHANEMKEMRELLNRSLVMKEPVKEEPSQDNVVLSNASLKPAFMREQNIVLDDDTDNYKKYMTSEMPSEAFKPIKSLDDVIDDLEQASDDLFSASNGLSSLNAKGKSIRL